MGCSGRCTVIDGAVLASLLGLVAGTLLGVAFVSWLRASLRRIMAQRRAPLLVWASSLLRVAAMASAFLLMAAWGPWTLAGALPGFLIGRTLGMRWEGGP